MPDLHKSVKIRGNFTFQAVFESDEFVDSSFKTCLNIGLKICRFAMICTSSWDNLRNFR